ncbi:Crotonobetainyl-CoA:carnitine CoA-transferase CaiB [Pseudosulfitobacter pseudonitzschiae]|uniref:Acyl-CoA transferase n=1 Tax=Pseudosulfitobacter pseudonitzschiae TaxID=1402135 RepID=A0A073IV86_9RHOB|nr:CoA transferase [Pseudosulfitobacter pseudonitzschiae]KEJ94253.1 acyl-CoA transferase [Pseudosulfitobacter pseudonitzschiae]QKS11052.1 CoA transferase [Pseudosulfitobacter pseudonitzschiae]SHG05310.1 Crotonobetainyl-CoA:carnitine CoA-transferase CaiB [Pseudosulfitobacter pseudonitzschiae]
MFQPLKGIRVIDLSQVLAGPYATYQLALMGAEVIKIEKPGEGDWTRTGGPLPGLAEQRMALGFLGHNAGKRSVTLDLKTPEGLAVARQLMADADVFVENFKPGVAERLGLGFEALRGINPKLVYCSISAFGQDGPFSNRPAYDHVIQGMCGIMLTTGKPGDGPVKVGAPYIDYATGMNAAMAIMAALREVDRIKTAVHVDVAMLDTAMTLMASLMTTHLTTGWKPVQNGNEAWSASPSSGAFETADGILMLAANHDAQFRDMCMAIGREDILQDPRWETVAERHANWKSLRESLEETFLTEPAMHWEDVLAVAAVPAGRIRGLDEMLAEPQIAARGLTREIHVDGHEGTIHIPTMSFKVNGANSTSELMPQQLGADTDAVLRAAGYSQDTLDALRSAKVI